MSKTKNNPRLFLFRICILDKILQNVIHIFSYGEIVSRSTSPNAEKSYSRESVNGKLQTVRFSSWYSPFGRCNGAISYSVKKVQNHSSSTSRKFQNDFVF